MESDHSQWSNELADITRELAEGQGVFIERLPVNSQIEIKTQNSTYRLRVIDSHQGRIVMVGQSKFFEDGEQCTFVGSINDQSTLIVHWLGVHMHLDIAKHGPPVEHMLSSSIATIRIHPPPPSATNPD